MTAKYVASSLLLALSPLAVSLPRSLLSVTLFLLLDLGVDSFGLISLRSQHSELSHTSTEYLFSMHPSSLGSFRARSWGSPFPLVFAKLRASVLTQGGSSGSQLALTACGDGPNKRPAAITLPFFNGCYFNWVFSWDRHEGKSNLQPRLLPLGTEHTLKQVQFLCTPSPLFPSPLLFSLCCSLALNIPPTSGFLPTLQRVVETMGYGPGGRKNNPKVLQGGAGHR